jgi:hypothetical protein
VQLAERGVDGLRDVWVRSDCARGDPVIHFVAIAAGFAVVVTAPVGGVVFVFCCVGAVKKRPQRISVSICVGSSFSAGISAIISFSFFQLLKTLHAL